MPNTTVVTQIATPVRGSYGCRHGRVASHATSSAMTNGAATCNTPTTALLSSSWLRRPMATKITIEAASSAAAANNADGSHRSVLVELTELASVEQQRQRVAVGMRVLELLDQAHDEVMVARVDDLIDGAVHPRDGAVEHG